jgi:ABC-2 type transport system permease protein
MSRSLFRDLGQSLRHPEFWAYSSWLDIAIRYRRTQLGLSWLVLAFAFFVVVMGFKYSYLMGQDPQYFLPYLGIGYMVWRFMVTVLNDAVQTLVTHRSYIMDGRICLTDYLLRSVAKAMFHFFFALLVLVFVLAWSQPIDVAWLLSLLVTFPLLVANMIWLSVCIGFFGARYPDTQEFIGTVLMAGFLLTPIIWDVSKFPPDTTRGFLTRLNPAFHLVEVARAPVLGHMPETNSIIAVVAMAIAGWALAAWMYRRYARFVPLWV